MCRHAEKRKTDVSVRQAGKEGSLKVLLIEHPASDHLQVLKHLQVSPLFWPGINVQITCTSKSDKDTEKTSIEESQHALYTSLLRYVVLYGKLD